MADSREEERGFKEAEREKNRELQLSPPIGRLRERWAGLADSDLVLLHHRPGHSWPLEGKFSC